MAMVGGGIFWLVRALLAAIPALVLHYPIKKWAAVGALAASVFYLTISGSIKIYLVNTCNGLNRKIGVIW